MTSTRNGSPKDYKLSLQCKGALLSRRTSDPKLCQFCNYIHVSSRQSENVQVGPSIPIRS